LADAASENHVPFVFLRIAPIIISSIFNHRSHYNYFAVLVDFHTLNRDARLNRGLDGLGHVALFERLLAARHWPLF
jgi:hypothetical protein